MLLEVNEGATGLVFVTCKEPSNLKGLLVAGKDLKDAMDQVPQAISDLETARLQDTAS